MEPDVEAELVATLHNQDGDDLKEHGDGASHRPGFAGSVGAKSHRSETTAKYAKGSRVVLGIG